MYFADNSLLFPTMKNLFQNRLTVDEVIAKKFKTTFFETQCRMTPMTKSLPD